MWGQRSETETHLHHIHLRRCGALGHQVMGTPGSGDLRLCTQETGPRPAGNGDRKAGRDAAAGARTPPQLLGVARPRHEPSPTPLVGGGCAAGRRPCARGRRAAAAPLARPPCGGWGWRWAGEVLPCYKGGRDPLPSGRLSSEKGERLERAENSPSRGSGVPARGRRQLDSRVQPRRHALRTRLRARLLPALLEGRCSS